MFVELSNVVRRWLGIQPYKATPSALGKTPYARGIKQPIAEAGVKG
jgi:hypothetical protein